MKTQIRKISFTLVFFFALSNLSFAAELPSLLTLYNSETTQSGTASTMAVVRQESGQVKLFSCQKRYTGDLRNPHTVLRFFNEGLDSFFERRTNCLPYQDSVSTYVNGIKNQQGNYIRWVLSMPAASDILSGVFSDLAVWTIDVHSGINGVPSRDTILLTGMRITHDRMKNPEMQSYRDTYSLSGMAQLNFPEI